MILKLKYHILMASVQRWLSVLTVQYDAAGEYYNLTLLRRELTSGVFWVPALKSTVNDGVYLCYTLL